MTLRPSNPQASRLYTLHRKPHTLSPSGLGASPVCKLPNAHTTEEEQAVHSCPVVGEACSNLRALIIRTRFGGMYTNKYRKEPQRNSIGNHQGPYIRSISLDLG